MGEGVFQGDWGPEVCFCLGAFWLERCAMDSLGRLDVGRPVRKRKIRKQRTVPSAPLTWWLLPLTLTGLIGVWALIVQIGDFAPFILPGPDRVAARFLEMATNGSLWRHSMVTLVEVLIGLAIGLVTALFLGYLLAKSWLVEQIASPLIVASQAIPIVALAPLLVIWFGPGMLSKVLVCSLVVFFPVLITVIVGLRSVEPDLVDLMRSLQASRWETLTKLELPAALPVLLGGLKVGATLAVIGAVVGEFTGADRGLGFLVVQSRGLYDTAQMFVAFGALATIALALYGAVLLLERRLLRWR
jgi:NitT/TauT family transport system permease protein